MAFNTKIRIDDQHVEQVVNSTLTLSGDTRYATHPNFTGDTQIIDKKYVDDNIISATGSTVYDLESPAALEVGGIDVGYVLTGKTANEILQDLLVPELYQTTVGTPTTSLSVTPTGVREVGCVITTLTVDPTYIAGAITPLYATDGGTTRGGAAISYCYTGPSMGAGFVAAGSCSVSNYAVTAGAQSWNACTCFDAGATIRGSKGTLNPSVTPNPLPAGCTAAGTAGTITGCYPHFYGSSASDPTLNSALLATGSKVVADSSGQININFGTACGVYLWFATPQTSTTKQGWYEGATNKGNIGILPTDVWNAPVQNVSVNSPESCWSSVNYKMYKMNVTTSVNGTVYCMTNDRKQ